ncbi:hypothetical protein PF005_g22673 [Phytophthora fragariae]|uniref:Uncharacterized protein n=1 Tax=Phytophthora fragariae TaxID=53985 RepID=A0A6A3WGL6_9STRA|nr:hypothetical protein PF006_g21781 [Phytophthora fragariae]KAE9181965.1 hypothetical protein PF005_g22673 [Phytophthora fragariae]
MVAPTPKAPRYQLTEQERRLLHEALLSERHGRRIRRAEQKESNEGAGRTKKATRKKPAKHTSPAMEVAESKRVPPPEPTPGPASPAATKAAIAHDGNDAKEVADDEAPKKQKKTTGKGKKQTQTTGKSKKQKPTTGKGKKKAGPPGPAAEGPAAAVDASVDAPALAVVEEVMAAIVATVSGTTPREWGDASNHIKTETAPKRPSRLGGEEEETETGG